MILTQTFDSYIPSKRAQKLLLHTEYPLGPWQSVWGGYPSYLGQTQAMEPLSPHSWKPDQFYDCQKTLGYPKRQGTDWAIQVVSSASEIRETPFQVSILSNQERPALSIQPSTLLSLVQQVSVEYFICVKALVTMTLRKWDSWFLSKYSLAGLEQACIPKIRPQDREVALSLP